MNVEERARAVVKAWRKSDTTKQKLVDHVARAMHELQASPLPAPMTPAELAKAEALARRIDAQFGSDRLGDILTSLTLSFTEEDSEVIGAVVVVFRRLLDHALRLGDDVRRMAQDNGYLEGLAEGAKRGRASLLPLLRKVEWCAGDGYRGGRCLLCHRYRDSHPNDPAHPYLGDLATKGHAPDCELARALAEGG